MSYGSTRLALAALLAASFSAGVSAPIAVSAAGPTTIGTSSCTADSKGVFPCAQAYQRSAQDKVAYLHDGSLLVGFYDGHTGVLYHVTNPSTTPASTLALTFPGGEAESMYTLPGSGSTEIWVLQGNEIFGGAKQEQIQHGTYDGTNFSWDGGNTNPVPVQVPGALTNGRQDPSVTWTGKWLIASWWDDTVGGNSDNVFYNWTTDRTGKTGWAVPMKSGTVSTDTSGGSTSISYNVVSGAAPSVGDSFQIGNAVSNDGTVTCVDMTPVPCNAEFRQVTAVSGSGPYAVSIAALNNHHFIGEPIRIAANLLTTTQQNSVQVSIRHSNKLGATIAVYGAFCKVLSRTLLDTAADPSPANWNPESQLDVDDCDAVLNGPQIAIDQNSGDIHVFKAMTSGEPSPTGIIYWHGVPDATFSTTGKVNWSSRVVIDPAASSFESDPPDIAGTVDPSTHRVYVFWVTKATGGVVKYVTLDSPYTSASGETTMTTGTQPRYTHVPSLLFDPSTSKAAYVPLVYQTGTSCLTTSCTSTFNIVLDTSVNIQAPTVPAGLTATATSATEVDLAWHASTDDVGVTGYTVYRNGVSLAIVSGSTLTYADKSVAEATTYSYTVDAFNAGGNHSAQSSPASATTPDITPPSVPTGLSATATSTPQVNLSWSASTDNVGVTGYTIYRNGSMITTVPGSTVTYTDTNVVQAGSYSYTVDAFDAAGNHSAQSAPATVNTPDSTPPSVPTGLTATFVSTTPQVNLAWNASTDNVGVTGYTIYRNGAALNTVSGSTLTYADKAIVVSAGYVYTVDAFDAAGNHSAQSGSADINPGVYTAITPKRVLDTRSNGGKLGPGGSMNLVIAGTNGVPANASAVILNVTAVDESTAGFFTVYPTGATLPTASNLNWVAGETVPNLVSVGLGAGGKVTIYNGLGMADAVVDLEGYFAPSGGGTAGQFVPVVPARITDTRASSGQPNHGLTLTAGTTLNVQVTGVGGIPASGVTAVVLNTTVTDTTSAGFLTVFPTGAGLPVASNLNWMAGVTVPNRVIVPVGTGGKVSFYNGLGSADLIVDVNGYFTDSTGTGASFVPLTPSRIVDTRMGGGAPLGPGATMTVTMAGKGGVPATGAKAVVLNVTVVNPTAASALTVWPADASRPLASDLNFVAGQTVPNLVVVKLSANGQFDIFNAFGTTNVIVDVVGWYG
jgi:chitodextrinase